MGITYEFKIHFFKVKDISKVDTSVIECTGENWENKLKNYKEESKKNILEKLDTFKHDPSSKNGYTALSIPVPAFANVVAIGNAACDWWSMTNKYRVYFFNKNRESLKTEVVTADFEFNHFMMVIPKHTAFINYAINFNKSDPYFKDKYHDFRKSHVCRRCNPDYVEPYEFNIAELGGNCKIQ